MVLATPETWLSEAGRSYLTSKFVRDNQVCLAIDEVHKVTW